MGSIKFYTDTGLLDENTLKVVMFPLMDCLMANKILESNSDFEFVEDVEDCDIFLFPIAIEQMVYLGRKNEVETFILKAKINSKRVLVFTSGDVGLTLSGDNVLVLRLGGFNSRIKKNTFIMPPFIEDPYIKIKGKFIPIEKTDKPIIGFVGHANGKIIKLVKEYLIYIKLFVNRIIKKKYIDYQSFYPSSFFRYKYLKLLEKDINIETNFVYRKKYRAGAKTQKELDATTLEFYQNINECPYTFCMRGVGNFSVRFYETLAMGRIPVLINTDCRLPFSEHINWNKHCLIIDNTNVKNIGSCLLQFHQSIPKKRFQHIQESNRKLWETYFTKYQFFIKLKQHLINDLK
jgi:hypothetical protein